MNVTAFVVAGSVPLVAGITNAQPVGRFIDFKPVEGSDLDFVGAIDGSPAISNDGLELFFHSNRPGTDGNRDIYVVNRATRDEPFGNVTKLVLCQP